MIVLLWIVLQSAPVQYGEALIRKYHAYDIEACRARVEPIPLGARIRCEIQLTAATGGPLSFLLTKDIVGLRVTRDGKPAEHSVVGGGLNALVKLVAPDVQGIPTLLEVRPRPPLRPGERATLVFDYEWLPGAVLRRGSTITDN